MAAPSWSIKLPIYKPDKYDNSIIECHATCPRLALFKYVLRRGPVSVNYPIGFGLAYHKYREEIQLMIVEEKIEDFEIPWEIHMGALKKGIEYIQEPPPEHKHAFLNKERYVETCNKAKKFIENERRFGTIEIIQTEIPFEVPFPMPLPNGEEFVFGGRMDQIVSWRGKLWMRDFKTTSRMGKSYSQKFNPNNQFSGYTWAGTRIAQSSVDGVLVEVIYNTKTKGPEIHQFPIARTPGQIEQWMASTYVEVGDFLRNIEEIPTRGYLAFPQRTNACDNYGGCYFRDACQQDSSWALERWLENNTEYKEWDFTDPDKDMEEGNG